MTLRETCIGLAQVLLLGKSAGAAEDAVTAAARRNFGEYLELLAIENVRTNRRTCAAMPLFW